jgi:anti-sigma B factor antagonist
MNEGRPRFSVRTEHAGPSTVVVVVTGEVDIETAPTFERELAGVVEGGFPKALIVDLTAVTFIDSTGLTALVRAFERQRLAGNQLGIVSDDSRVAMMLEVSRLDRVLRTYRTCEEALASFE